MSATQHMAQLIAGARVEDLTVSVRQRIRQHLKDTLGVMIAAAAEPAARTVRDVVALGGVPEYGACVIGSEHRAAPWEAAWANGTLAHLLDYDDYGFGHPSACIVPAALAAADAEDASGLELMLGLALGWEVFDRLSRACRGYERTMRGRGLHVTAVYAGPAAAAAAGKLMGLDQAQLAVALGLAGSSSTGLTEQFGTWGKGMQAGTAARAGVLGAVLADRDYWAADTVIEGVHGLLNAYAGEGNYDASVFDDGLDRGWAIDVSGFSLKRFPACGGNVRGIDAALELRQQLVTDPAQIARIDVEPSESILDSLHIDRPKRGFEGKFCLRFTLASALADGDVTVDSFSDEMLARPIVQQLMDRTTVTVRPGGYRPGPDVHRMPVTVTMADGSTASREIAEPRGHTKNRLTDDEIRAKFVSCAGRLGSEESVLRLDSAIDNIDSISARELVAAVAAVASHTRLVGSG